MVNNVGYNIHASGNKKISKLYLRFINFCELIMCYSYYNKNFDDYLKDNEFRFCNTSAAVYLNCSGRSVIRWLNKLKDLGALKKAIRDDYGEIGYYKQKNKETGKFEFIKYTKPKYKKIKIGKKNEMKFINIYTLDLKMLNDYLIENVNLDILGHIEEDKYKKVFKDYIIFLANLKSNKDITKVDENVGELTEETKKTMSKKEREAIKKSKKIIAKSSENKFYIRMLDALNDDPRNVDFQCRYIGENSLRLTHSICNTINPFHIDKIDNTNFWRKENARHEMLENILGCTDFVELDVNGSIYRLTYNLYHDTLLDEAVDIYELIWKAAFNIDWPDLDKKSKKSKKLRNAFKSMLMPIYMKEYLTAYKSYRYKSINKYYYGKKRYNNLTKGEQNMFETYKSFTDVLGIPVEEFLSKVKQAMHDVLGPPEFLKADVFIHESNLHILMRKMLLDRNIMCVNVYDGFYFEKGIITEEEFYEVYHECTIQLKENLKKGIGSPIPQLKAAA